MDRKWLVGIVIAGTTLAACGGAKGPGTAWGDGSFSSNGERIYFTATSERGTDIDSSGGPDPTRGTYPRYSIPSDEACFREVLAVENPLRELAMVSTSSA